MILPEKSNDTKITWFLLGENVNVYERIVIVSRTVTVITVVIPFVESESIVLRAPAFFLERIFLPEEIDTVSVEQTKFYHFLPNLRKKNTPYIEKI